MASSGELLEAINYVPMIQDEFVRLVVNIKKRGVHNFTLPFLEDRLAALEKWLNVLHKTHVKITTHTKSAELAKMEYVTDSWYQAALDAHSDAEVFILGHLDELRSNQVMSSSDHTAPSGEINQIRLPVIDLPKFSGDYLEWNNFYETFRSIVHDKVYVSGRDKFHYLKSCLQGEAATVIKSLAITSENYEIAWDTLVARYTDKRMITDTFLDQISQVPTLRGDNFKVLKEVRDSVTVALNALKTMGYGVDQWDPIIVHSLKNKLDDTLRLAWEMYLGSSKDYPSFIQFSEFLTRHINSLQSLENAKIFDPLGWISPIVITLKQLMQSTWLLKLSWDEEIPEPIQSKWLKCYEQLCDLQALSIPRWTGQSLTTRKRELIGFCDASELAYGAVAYERLTDENGHFSVHLVMSKTKVAPIKITSIPRLELVAAALLVKLLVHVKTSLVGSCDAIRCYSDSQVALAWIAKQPVHWKTFVANRVSYVQTHLPEASWHYVPTKLNPADLCSRGTSVQQLSEDSLWWHGPAFLQTLHGGLQLTLSTLRQRFWVVNARNLVKSCVHKCITCVRKRAKLGNQLMGSLPAARVSRSFTFEHTGVDYAGPFSAKLHHGRNAKAIKCYVAVFVCLSTRAVHLELVSRLDTEAFLAALSRFISRRGKPAVMYSDNGLNFQGADAELKCAYQCAVEAARARKTDSFGEIEWKFIPVATPHWGGLWESAVKSMKHHLKRSLGVFVPNFEEMTTLLTKIEACLNSRPISRLHDDPESLDVLTPGHFLSGRALNSPPEFSTLDLRESSLNRWQTVTRITETFWKKWSSEYLHTLQNRPKWQNTNSEFGEGDLVLIKVPNNPPRMWTLGRILKLVPGVDGVKAEFDDSYLTPVNGIANK
ncbi:uncharacterized protein [Prorops nasuta]|uniref:uncharacterized protein n=1 Tax=Prorops nasuta TaxID=863751 RepID=UPI0034CDB0E1